MDPKLKRFLLATVIVIGFILLIIASICTLGGAFLVYRLIADRKISLEKRETMGPLPEGTASVYEPSTGAGKKNLVLKAPSFLISRIQYKLNKKKRSIDYQSIAARIREVFDRITLPKSDKLPFREIEYSRKTIEGLKTLGFGAEVTTFEERMQEYAGISNICYIQFHWGEKVLIIGDTHGLIDDLLEKLSLLEERYYIIVLGDMIHSKGGNVGVGLTFLLQLCQYNLSQMLILRGNHESVCEDAINDVFTEFYAYRKGIEIKNEECVRFLKYLTALPIGLVIQSPASGSGTLCIHSGPGSTKGDEVVLISEVNTLDRFDLTFDRNNRLFKMLKDDFVLHNQHPHELTKYSWDTAAEFMRLNGLKEIIHGHTHKFSGDVKIKRYKDEDLTIRCIISMNKHCNIHVITMPTSG